MTITYLGHSCFKLESGGFSIIIDPYKNGKVPGLGNLNETADAVLCSHDHDDHNGAELIKLTGRQNLPFGISVIKTYHDDAKGSKRGMNKIHIIEAEGYKIVHLGDLGCGITPEQEKLLANSDVLMIPVGGYYTIDSDEALSIVNELKPFMVIPMHYRDSNTGFDVIDTVENFLLGFDKSDIYFTGSEYTLNRNKSFSIVVMKPKYKI